MIGSRPALGTGFGGLQQYLLHGRKGATPHRAVWTSTRNLPGEDPEKAARIMRATANRSLRVEKPVYHLSVSLAPGERLDRPQLEQVADRLLRDLGLHEHQVLIAEHADGAQQHIHLMVNRVQPDTARAWKASHDYARIERSLRAQEQELGLRIVPGRHAPVPGHERFKGTRLSTGPFPGQVRELAGESFREASTWQELHASLSRYGLTLQPSRSGRGLVVTDGRQYVAASKVARGASHPRLESRLGRYEPASPDLEKLQRISQMLDRRARLRTVQKRYQGALFELNQALAHHHRVAGHLAQASKRLDEILGRAYRDPRAARRYIENNLARHGISRSLEALRGRPASFGKLRGGLASRERGKAHQVLRERGFAALHDYAGARRAKEAALERLEQFRRNPRHPVLGAADRARQVLSRGLKRLERVDRRYAPAKQLRAQAASVVRRLGWRAVSRLVPSPAYQALRVAVSLARVPGRVRGHDRGR